MSNELYTSAMYAKGLADAADLQSRAPEMDGTALYAEEEKIPDFQAARQAKNMLQRAAGFICRSSAGRVVKLLQVYDSDTYPQEPEELPAQWGFKWSTDPAKALPFIALSTSPYGKGECCTEGGKVYRSTIDNNVWAPSAYPQGWEEVSIDDGPIEPAPEEPDEPSTEPEQPEEGGESSDDDDPYKDVKDFVQPTGAHDAYNVGDRVKYNGHVYESTIANNAYSPDAYPQGWKLLA